MRNANRLFGFLLGMAVLWGCCGAASAATPQVSAGTWHTVALKSDGTVVSWGYNYAGQLGVDGLGNGVLEGAVWFRSQPLAVPGLTGVASVVAGGYHNLAIKSDGTVMAWGMNRSGQLGDGTTTNRSSPMVVPGLTGVVAGATGGWAAGYSVVLKSDGTVMAWGDNTYGQLGDGTTMNRSSPLAVPGLIGVVAVSAGDSYTVAEKPDGTYVSRDGAHTVALKFNGTVMAWGNNTYGELGDGTTTNRSSPVAVPGLTGVVALAAGVAHTVALKSDGTVMAWGDNTYGQLGDGTTTNHSSPVAVPGLAGVVALAAAGLQTVALKSDGTVMAWGMNTTGPYGDGTITQRTSPESVPGFSDVVAVATGSSHIVALKSDGTVVAWGNNYSGSLGNGTFAQQFTGVYAINETLDGVLDLLPVLPNLPNAAFPPFFSVASSNGPIVSTKTTITNIAKFNAADVNRSNAVFVTAMVPSNSPLALSASNVLRAKALAASAANTFVQIQLTSTGWQQVIGGQLIPLASGVLGDLLAAQTILNGTDTTNLKGAQFCVGYGTSAAEMIATGKMRVVATIPTDPNATSQTTVSCIVDGSSVVTVYVVEFYNTNLDNYFITANASEAAAIGGGSAGPGWSRTGNSFKSGGNTSVCRFYGSMSPGPNSHFYTVDAAECQSLKDQQIPAGDPRKLTEKSWNFESLDFVSTPPVNGACSAGTTPVYRAYNNGFSRGVDSNHRITSSQTAIQQVVTRGWKNEGVVMCAPN